MYTGWMVRKSIPFQNNLGLAEFKNNSFYRVSKAPIFPINNEDYLGIGSSCIFSNKNELNLFYTSFTDWKKIKGKIFHNYHIKKATLKNNRWEWNICKNGMLDNSLISSDNIARPCVIENDSRYYMFFCHRNNHQDYKLGLAESSNLNEWKVINSEIERDFDGDWDSDSWCYPYVFKSDNDFYMLYAGNNYGQNGFGLAKLKG